MLLVAGSRGDPISRSNTCRRRQHRGNIFNISNLFDNDIHNFSFAQQQTSINPEDRYSPGR
jgi:hypothetical protein